MTYTQINKNVSVTTIKKDKRVYLHLKKHQPIIINADDKYRKGIEIDICAKCHSVCIVTMSDDKKCWCSDCALKVIKEDGK